MIFDGHFQLKPSDDSTLSRCPRLCFQGRLSCPAGPRRAVAGLRAFPSVPADGNPCPGSAEGPAAGGSPGAGTATGTRHERGVVAANVGTPLSLAGSGRAQETARSASCWAGSLGIPAATAGASPVHAAFGVAVRGKPTWHLLFSVKGNAALLPSTRFPCLHGCGAHEDETRSSECKRVNPP